MIKRILYYLTCLITIYGQNNEQTVGLFLNTENSSPGYNLFAPNSYNVTYLMDNNGNLIHSWQSDFRPGLSVYLTEEGQLLRTQRIQSDLFQTGGHGGGVELLNWDGSLDWEFEYADNDHWQHHDIELLPNGNILILAWELKSTSDAVNAGRNPSFLGGGGTPLGLWPEHIVEVDTDTDSIVWEWHTWDHLIQDYDSTKSNFGIIAEHPERININFPQGGPLSHGGDWLHINSIDYNADLDQILLSVHHWGEIWVIDHSTTTAEAASDSGGNNGRGGNILYRWGNTTAYNMGNIGLRFLYGQHDARWINDGSQIMIFNNGIGRPDGPYSSVDVLSPTLNSINVYEMDSSGYFGPDSLDWRYIESPPTQLFSSNISGAHVLDNGNTLITDGVHGRYFEVDSSGNTVWDYINPIIHNGPLYQGQPVPPMGGPNSNMFANHTFRIHRYSPYYPGLVGQDLIPQGPLEFYYPTPVEILTPEQGDTILVTEENIDSGFISFTWSVSTDLNNDSLTYDLILFNSNIGSHYFTTSSNHIEISYQTIADFMVNENSSAMDILWNVRVSDGLAEVMSSNGPFIFNVGVIFLSVDSDNLQPDNFLLYPNFPNPFNPTTTLRYDLPQNSFVNITIYDLNGREVKKLVRSEQVSGNHSLTWNGTNDQGKLVSAGVYLYQIQSGEFVQTKKMVLMK